MRTSCLWVTAIMLALFVNDAAASEPQDEDRFCADVYTAIRGHHKAMYGCMPFADGTLSYSVGVYSGGGRSRASVEAIEKDCGENIFKTATSLTGNGSAYAFEHYNASLVNVRNVSEGGLTITNSRVEVTSCSTSMSMSITR
jgi:hypothetical protein